MNTLPNRIRHLRAKRGLTLAELSGQTGKSVSYIQKLELGERGLRPGETRDLADALGVPPADLLSLDDGALTGAERALIAAFRAADPRIRDAVNALLAQDEPPLPIDDETGENTGDSTP